VIESITCNCLLALATDACMERVIAKPAWYLECCTFYA